MRWSSVFFRGLCFTVLATAALAQPDLRGSTNRLPDEQSLAFGAKIIDIALAFDAAAHQSLAGEPDSDVRAQMTFTDASGIDKTYDVKLRIKGHDGSKRSIDGKPAFRVTLGKDDRFFGIERLTLNNMVQDPTMLHEALGYQVYEAAGVKVAATGYVRLTVNGQAYGLYLNVETLDADFLKRRFGDDIGILYEGAYGVDLRAGDIEKFELHEGKDPHRAALKELIGGLDTPGDAVFYGDRPQVDTESFLAMMAAEALLGDWDSYYGSNNYRIYWNPSASRWSFIPTGIDQSFGVTTVFGATGLLFQKCLASERCTSDYANKVRDVADRFERLGLPAKMDALLSVVDAASKGDPKRKNSVATMTHARDAMRSLIAKRPDQVRAALSCLDGGRESTIGACAGAVTVNAAVNQCAEVSNNVKKDGMAVSVSLCSGTREQRWRLMAKGDVFELVSASSGNCLNVTQASKRNGTRLQQRACAGIDSQLFSLRPMGQGTQLVAKHSGKCVGVAPGNPGASRLIQATCGSDAAQTWHVKRSIYE